MKTGLIAILIILIALSISHITLIKEIKSARDELLKVTEKLIEVTQVGKCYIKN